MRFAQLDRATPIVLAAWLLICGCGKQEASVPAQPDVVPAQAAEKSAVESFKEFTAQIAADVRTELQGKVFVRDESMTEEENARARTRNLEIRG